MADDENKEVVTQVFRIHNIGPGPRQVLLPTEGKTIPKGGNVVLRLTENDVKGIQPYISLGHLRLEVAQEDELPRAVSADIGGDIPLKTGNPVDSASVGGEGDIVPTEPEVFDQEGNPTDTETEIDQNAPEGQPTHVEHRGFGRWYGFAGDEKITEAMTEDEADAYAEEHGLQKPVAANPSEDDTPAEEPAPSTDETTNEEPGS